MYDATLEVAFYDQEWGVPVHDDRKHFEFIILDCSRRLSGETELADHSTDIPQVDDYFFLCIA